MTLIDCFVSFTRFAFCFVHCILKTRGRANNIKGTYQLVFARGELKDEQCRDEQSNSGFGT